MNKRVVVTALCLTSVLCVAVAGSLRSPMAHSARIAATESTDPSVVVVEDATGLYGPCVNTREKYVDTSQQVTISSPCLPWTVSMAVHMPRSQALGSNLPYVVLPSPDASSAELQKAQQEIEALFDSARPDLHLGVVQSYKVTGNQLRPDSCSSPQHEISSTAAWLNDPGGLQREEVYVSVDFETYYPCGTLYLNHSNMGWVAETPNGYNIDGSTYRLYTTHTWQDCSTYLPKYPSTVQSSLNVSVTANYSFLFRLAPYDYIQNGCETAFQINLGPLS